MDSKAVVKPAAKNVVAAAPGSSESPRSPYPLGALILFVLLVYFWLSGTFLSTADAGFWMSSAQATGTSLTYSTMPAFLIVALLYGNRQFGQVLDQLISSGSLPHEAGTRLRDKLGGVGWETNAAATVVGLIAGSLNIPWEMVVNNLSGPIRFMALSIAVGNLVLWLAVAHVLTRRVILSNALLRAGREHAHVDLFRLDALLPFGRVGTLGVLMVAITVSLAALQSLDGQARWSNYNWAFGVGIPAGLALLLIPMIGIRQRVRHAKREALASLDEAIAAADRDLGPDPLRYLGDLLQRRDTIENAREWPLDTTALSRIAIYFIIPPIAWVGGAIVEIAIQAGIGSG